MSEISPIAAVRRTPTRQAALCHRLDEEHSYVFDEALPVPGGLRCVLSRPTSPGADASCRWRGREPRRRRDHAWALLVRYLSTNSAADRATVERRYGATRVPMGGQLGRSVLDVPGDAEQRVLNALARRHEVQFVEVQRGRRHSQRPGVAASRRRLLEQVTACARSKGSEQVVVGAGVRQHHEGGTGPGEAADGGKAVSGQDTSSRSSAGRWPVAASTASGRTMLPR
jgi:hypothetical protein